jgi:hypothetical protein
MSLTLPNPPDLLEKPRADLQLRRLALDPALTLLAKRQNVTPLVHVVLCKPKFDCLHKLLFPT